MNAKTVLPDVAFDIVYAAPTRAGLGEPEFPELYAVPQPPQNSNKENASLLFFLIPTSKIGIRRNQESYKYQPTALRDSSQPQSSALRRATVARQIGAKFLDGLIT